MEETIVIKLLYIVFNDFDAKKSTCYNRVLVLTELVNGRTQCLVVQTGVWYKAERILKCTI